MSLTNRQLAELLALESEQAKDFARKALRRASRLAFAWPVEATTLLEEERSLTELVGVGPFVASRLRAWIVEPPPPPRPDPLRKDFLTMTEAHQVLARSPDWQAGLRGDLQMHSTYSDGGSTISELAAAAGERGYEYIAITDHSEGLKIAGGIGEEEFEIQRNEIVSLNDRLASDGRSLRVLRSIELNLDPTGAGDMNSSFLSTLDLVLGSFHSRLRTKDDQTPRYLGAIRNPDLHILGHPRGRIYNFRLGLTADWPRVFAEAARLDKAVEIDAFPDRQDLNLALLRLAKKEGVRISIGTDAHYVPQLDFIDLGLAAAKKAGIPRARVVNLMPRDELLAWVESIRASSPSR